jgi:cytoskeletal protein RodZ
MSDNTPTERFDLTPTGQETGDVAVAKKSNTLLYVLIGIGVLLLLGILAVLISTLANGSGQPIAAETPSPSVSESASPTPSETPSQAPSESASQSPSETNAAPPANDTKPGFTSFTAPKVESGCASGPNFVFNPTIRVSWKTKNAESVWFVQGTSDAVDSQFKKLPKNGDQDDFPDGIPEFPCSQPSATYTLTILGTDGSHLSKQWTVKNTSPAPAQN